MSRHIVSISRHHGGEDKTGNGGLEYWGWRDGVEVMVLAKHIQKMLTEMKA